MYPRPRKPVFPWSNSFVIHMQKNKDLFSLEAMVPTVSSPRNIPPFYLYLQSSDVTSSRYPFCPQDQVAATLQVPVLHHMSVKLSCSAVNAHLLVVLAIGHRGLFTTICLVTHPGLRLQHVPNKYLNISLIDKVC